MALATWIFPGRILWSGVCGRLSILGGDWHWRQHHPAHNDNVLVHELYVASKWLAVLRRRELSRLGWSTRCQNGKAIAGRTSGLRLDRHFAGLELLGRISKALFNLVCHCLRLTVNVPPESTACG